MKEFQTQRKQRLIIIGCVVWSILNGLSLYPIYDKICLDGRIIHREWLRYYNAGKYVDIVLCLISKVFVSCSVLIFNVKLVYLMLNKMRTKNSKIKSDNAVDCEQKPLTSLDYGFTDASSSSVIYKTKKSLKKTSSLHNNYCQSFLLDNNLNELNPVNFKNNCNNDYEFENLFRNNSLIDSQKNTADGNKKFNRSNILLTQSLNLIKRNQFKMKYCKKLKKMKLSCIVVLIITLPQIFADIGDFIVFILLAIECKNMSPVDTGSFYNRHNETILFNSSHSENITCINEGHYRNTISYLKSGTELLLIISLYNNFIACLLSNRKFRKKILVFL